MPDRQIREALANAVMHRDYAITGSKIMLGVFNDRVDVTRPGGLPNGLTVDRVRAGANPRSRNEYLAHFMSAMGYSKQRGRGSMIMHSEMHAFNASEPELQMDEQSKFVRFRFHFGGASSRP